jgi:hypothetical protein
MEHVNTDHFFRRGKECGYMTITWNGQEDAGYDGFEASFTHDWFKRYSRNKGWSEDSNVRRWGYRFSRKPRRGWERIVARRQSRI